MMLISLRNPYVSVGRYVLTLLLYVISQPAWPVTDIPDGLQFAIKKARLLENLDTTADALGASVSIFGDMALVGAPNADTDDADVNQVGTGVVYVFTWSSGSWTKAATLTADDGANDDRFGAAVSLSAEWAVVGAPGNDNAGGSYAGAVYVFRLFAGSWTQKEKLLATGGAASDSFGGSVSVYGDYIVAGAHKGDGAVVDSGAVYTFYATHINTKTSYWTQGAKLVAPAGAFRDYFGASVSLTSNAVMIGAYGDDEAGDLAGAVYTFRRSGSVYSQPEKLLADDATAGDWFGWKVSIDGDRALISTAHDDNLAGDVEDMGSAYIFDRVAAVWSQTQKLYPDESSTDYSFGNSISLSGDRAVIGNYGDTSPVDDVVGIKVGSAYVFDLNTSSGVWQQTDKLIASDYDKWDEFGRAVAVSGDRLIIGAPKEDSAGADAGAAYTFSYDGSNWDQTQKLKIFPDYELNRFGTAVSYQPGRAIVGAYGNDFYGEDAGSAEIFELSAEGIWQHTATLYAKDAEAGDRFGFSVDLGNNVAIVGASLEDSEGSNAGAAYIFEYIEPAGADPYWRQLVKLTAGTASTQFGISVGISTNQAVVGAPYNQGTGTAYTFVRGAGVWPRTQLAPTGLASSDNFGLSVSIDEPWLIVGANGSGLTNNQGSAYIFNLNNDLWSQTKILTADDGTTGDSFGQSVSLRQERTIVGAPTMDPIRGAAYIFDLGNNGWQQAQKLLPADETAYGRFGWSVGTDINDTVVVGAYKDDAQGTESGSVYVFDLLGDSWQQTNKFVSTETAGGDNFGQSVDITFGQMLIGAPQDDNENGNQAGVVYIYSQAGDQVYADGFE